MKTLAWIFDNVLRDGPESTAEAILRLSAANERLQVQNALLELHTRLLNEELIAVLELCRRADLEAIEAGEPAAQVETAEILRELFEAVARARSRLH